MQCYLQPAELPQSCGPKFEGFAAQKVLWERRRVNLLGEATDGNESRHQNPPPVRLLPQIVFNDRVPHINIKSTFSASMISPSHYSSEFQKSYLNEDGHTTVPEYATG